MHTAELVQLVVDLIEDESLVVVSSVVLHDVIHWEGRQDCSQKRQDSLSQTQQLSPPEVLRQTRGGSADGGNMLGKASRW